MTAAETARIDAQHAWTTHRDHCDVCGRGNDWCGDGRLLLAATSRNPIADVPKPRNGGPR